jgi:cellulose synthase/poly-beta-1,6-N-acetylglucosamine synthase-like glycosyltransferase
MASEPFGVKYVIALQVIFWVCVAVVVYAYALYPVVVWGLSRVFGRRPSPPAADAAAELPTMTVLIAAYNEESVIGQRIENALAMDYPRERLQIVIASDGSSDGTARIAGGYSDRGVRLLDYKMRRGKASVLNAAMSEVDTDLVLLSDANTEIDAAAGRAMARWFADPGIGVVCGRLLLVDPATGENADGLYWKYETFLKKCAARLGALLGSNGAIYTMRREVYVPIPAGTIVDDFVIPLLSRLKHGCRIVFDADAVATEESAENVAAEFKRRTRIGAGGFQAITLLWRLMNPLQGWVAFVFLSHKVLRWVCPFFMIGALVASAALYSNWFYRGMLAAQIAFYAASAFAGHVPGRGVLGKVVRLASMFTTMNLALLIGFWRWVRGSQKAAWERTMRVLPAGETAEVGSS